MSTSIRISKERAVSTCHKESEETVDSCFGKEMTKELYNSLELKKRKSL